jgi:tRNA modification GTPase
VSDLSDNDTIKGIARDSINDTIVGVATPPGEGGVGILRISGPQALRLARHVFRPPPALPRPRELILGRVIDVETEEVLDDAFLVYMRGPRSYTAEDVVELQVHGSPRVLAALTDDLVRLGARAAERGEFTMRAFMNGRIDLCQAEAVLDLITAETDSGVKQARGQVHGRLTRAIEALREDLLGLLSQTEVNLDFVEDDVPVFRRGDLLDRARRIDGSLGSLLESYASGRRLQQGYRTVLVGRSNTGKSSLFNVLLGRDRALVDAQPGTTRDYVEERLDLQGYPLRLIDTAGFRDAAGSVEAEGQRSSERLGLEADLAIFVLDRSERVSPEDVAIFDSLSHERIIPVLNKIDREPVTTGPDLAFLKGSPPVEVSAITGDGVGTLRARIVGELRAAFAAPRSDRLQVTRERHRELIERARQGLINGVLEIQSGAPLELAAIPLYEALHALDEILGKGAPDEVLERVFADFCIGK